MTKFVLIAATKFDVLLFSPETFPNIIFNLNWRKGITYKKCIIQLNNKCNNNLILTIYIKINKREQILNKSIYQYTH